MDRLIDCTECDDILVEHYSDISYASFVFMGKIFTQAHPHSASNETIKSDALDAMERHKKHNHQ